MPLFLLIDFPTVTNLYDFDNSRLVINLVDNAVITLADAVSFFSREFFIAVRPWFLGQRAHPICDAA